MNKLDPIPARLTLLAPDIVEAILDGRQGPDVTLARSNPFRRIGDRSDVLATG